MPSFQAALLVIAVALGLACAGDDGDEGSASTQPIVARASILMEPPAIGIGEVATATFVVTTPPEHRVLPIEMPEIARVWMLESIVEPTERSARRWLHRTRIRMRPRETGAYVFPGTEVVIESAQGDQQSLDVQARSFEVVSVLPEFPDRAAPFGLQEAAALPSGAGFLWPALAGAALALAGVAGWIGFSRARERAAKATAPRPESSGDESLWEWARAELAAAFDAVDREPRDAANRGAHFLRHYVESRFRTHTAAASTEELAQQRPPLAAHSHWPDFVRVLRRMDELRFRPVQSGSQSAKAEADRVRTALEELQAFFEHSSPPERRS